MQEALNNLSRIIWEYACKIIGIKMKKNLIRELICGGREENDRDHD